MAGWLRPEDLDDSIRHETERLTTMYFDLPVDARAEWLEQGRAFLRVLRNRARPAPEEAQP